jgi:hypothetical protein
MDEPVVVYQWHSVAAVSWRVVDRDGVCALQGQRATSDRDGRLVAKTDWLEGAALVDALNIGDSTFIGDVKYAIADLSSEYNTVVNGRSGSPIHMHRGLLVVDYRLVVRVTVGDRSIDLDDHHGRTSDPLPQGLVEAAVAALIELAQAVARLSGRAHGESLEG